MAFRTRRLALLQQVAQECGDVGIFHVGPWPVLLLSAPAGIAAVLAEYADRVTKSPLLLRHFRPLVGDGLVVSEGLHHRMQRRRLAPVFQPRRVAEYAPQITAAAERMRNRWSDGRVLDLTQEMSDLALDLMGITLFGQRLAAQANRIKHTVTELAQLANNSANTLIRLPASWPTPVNRRLRAVIAEVDGLITNLIAMRRASGSEHKDLLAMLLLARDEESGAAMTDQQVRDEAVTLFLAGYEATATLLTWTWYVLTTHPMIYSRVRAECEGVLAGRTPTQADLIALPYTLQVLKETLRLYPPAWVMLRQAQQPFDVQGYTVPAGMRIAVSPYVTQRRPDLFPNPDYFDPERWIPDREIQLPRYAFFPFGAGPHQCIGQHLAMMEAHLILATVVQHVTFEILPDQQITPVPLISLRPNKPIFVQVRRHTAI
jgi:cytochrome P450